MVYIICFLTAFVSLQHNFSPLVSGSCMVKDVGLRGMTIGVAWVAGYVAKWFTCLKAVTHPTTNRAER